MKTYDEMKIEHTKWLMHRIESLKSDILTTEDSSRKKGLEWALEAMKKELENIDEYTMYQIGNAVYEMLRDLETYYKTEKRTFDLQDLDKGIKNSFLIDRVCARAREMDISLDKLDYYFRNQIPTEKATKDRFIQMVNTNFGTNIPLTGELEELKKEFDEMHIDDPERDKKLVELIEMRSRAGRTHSFYTIPSLDENYLAAKERIAAKKNNI